MARFQKGVRFSHKRRRRGPCRDRHNLSENALIARQENLRKWKRHRTHSLTIVIRHLTYEAYWSDPRPGQRSSARRFRVSQPWISKLYKRARELGPEAARRRTTWEDFEHERATWEWLRAEHPNLFWWTARQVALFDETRRRQRQAAEWWKQKQWVSRDEIWGCILLTQEQKVQASAEFDRREYAKQHNPQSPTSQQNRI